MNTETLFFVERKRASFDIDAELLKELKIYATENDRHVYEIVEDSIRIYLNEQEPEEEPEEEIEEEIEEIEQIHFEYEDEAENLKEGIKSLIDERAGESDKVYKGVYLDPDIALFLDKVKHGRRSDLVNLILRAYLTENGLL
jgi:metal-responsive CopG/Arc/MetJ family transcriptional regulator